MAAVLERARDAAGRGSWAEASELFARLDPSGLEPADLESMADAAWWCCRIDDAIAARRKAYTAYVDAGEARHAAYAAWLISQDYGIKGESSAGLGWLKRAQRHVAEDADCVERGFVALTESDIARAAGDLDEAIASAKLAVDLGDRCASSDLHAMGIQTLGRALITSGHVPEGVGLLDEAMTLVTSRRISPMFTGVIYCNVVATCMERADLERASEWTEAAMAWCGSISELTPYHGICRMHRVKIASLRGEWEQAATDALRATEEMRGLEQHVLAEALYTIGEVHLWRGHLDAAEQWFLRALEHGRDPQPGLASVRRAQGQLEAAVAGLRLSLATTKESTLRRAHLLAAQVEVSIAAQDLPAARAAADALAEVATGTPSSLLDAIALMASASLHLAEREVDQAMRDAHAAWSVLHRMKLPYLAAKARVLVGLAAQRAGDTDRAQVELEAARAAFERLGASLDARAVGEHLLGAVDLPHGLSERELEVLRMVADGKTNREVASALVLSEKTVSRHLENIFRKLEVTSRAAATAFAFKHQLV